MALDSAKTILDAVRSDTSTKPYDTKGTVTRTDGDTAYVRLDGSSLETPFGASTVGVHAGDVVSVHVAHSGSFITGNLSRPSTDDGMAEKAAETAAAAKETAIYANSSAKEAAQYAEQAAEQVGQVYGTATEALDTAERASKLVDAASVSAKEAWDEATKAINRASAVEEILESLNYRIDHGDEQTLVRAYGLGVLVGKGGKNPCALVNADGSFSIVNINWSEVTPENLDDEQAEETDEDEKLWEPEGITSVIASFSSRTVIGEESGAHLEISTDGIAFSDGENTVSHIGTREMGITRLEVGESMAIGDWEWRLGQGGNLGLRWRG